MPNITYSTRQEVRQRVGESIGALWLSATGDAGGSTTTIVDTELRWQNADALNGKFILITSGTDAGLEREIIDYSYGAGAGTITFSPAVTTTTASKTYEVWDGSKAKPSNVNSFIRQVCESVQHEHLVPVQWDYWRFGDILEGTGGFNSWLTSSTTAQRDEATAGFVVVGSTVLTQETTVVPVISPLATGVKSSAKLGADGSNTELLRFTLPEYHRLRGKSLEIRAQLVAPSTRTLLVRADDGVSTYSTTAVSSIASPFTAFTYTNKVFNVDDTPHRFRVSVVSSAAFGSEDYYAADIRILDKYKQVYRLHPDFTYVSSVWYEQNVGSATRDGTREYIQARLPSHMYKIIRESPHGDDSLARIMFLPGHSIPLDARVTIIGHGFMPLPSADTDTIKVNAAYVEADTIVRCIAAKLDSWPDGRDAALPVMNYWIREADRLRGDLKAPPTPGSKLVRVR